MLGESRVKIDFLLWQTQLDWGYWSRFCPPRLLYQPTYPIAFNHQTPETRFGHKIQKLGCNHTMTILVQKISYIFTRVSQDMGIYWKTRSSKNGRSPGCPSLTLPPRSTWRPHSTSLTRNVRLSSSWQICRRHLGGKTSAQASGRETLLPPMYNTCNMDFLCKLFLEKVRAFTKGKLRMVKAMTGKAMARITLLRESHGGDRVRGAYGGWQE